MPAEPTIEVSTLIDSQGIRGPVWVVIALCALVALLDGMDLQSIGLAAPGMIAQLGIPPRVFGLVFSAALAGLAIGAFLLGPLADRVGRKGVLIGSTVCFGVFTLCTAYADSLGGLLVFRFLAGFGLGGAMPSFISLVSEYVPAPRRATMVSLLWSGFPLGGVVGGLLAARLIPAYGWPSVFVVGGVAPLVLAGLLAAVLPESAAFLINSGKPAARVAQVLRRVFPGAAIPAGARFVLRQESGGRDPATAASVRHLFSEGRAAGTLLLWVSFFFAFMTLVTNSSWSPVLLKGAGLAMDRAAIALAIYNFGSLFGSAVAGALLSRFGAYVVLPLTLAGGAAAYAAIGWAAPSLAGVMVAQGMLGLLLGCGSSGLIALAAIFYPSAVRSTGVGWATAVGRVGSFSGPLAVGVLVGAQWPMQTIFVAVACASVLGAVACAAMGRLRQRAPPAIDVTAAAG